MGWVKGSDRNFKASQTERYRKTKKDRRERRETSGGGPKIRVRGRQGEAQARERPARDRGLPLPKTCAARVVA